MNNKQLLTGIAIGAAAGAVLGILFAPDKGSNTRKKIATKASDFSDSVKERFNAVADSFSNKVSELKGQTKEKVRTMKAEAENAMS